MKRIVAAIVCFSLVFFLLCACARPAAGGAVEDISFTEGVVYAEAEEPFWEDGVYRYIFPCIMSWDCTVTYKNGGSENLIDALDAGRVTAEDMDTFDLPYRREPLPSEVVDIAYKYEGENRDYPDAVVEFFEDEQWIYTDANPAIYDYIVYYASGASENVPDALNGGRVSIADLDRFGVGYGKRARYVELPELVDIIADGEARPSSSISGDDLYTDYKYEYYLSGDFEGKRAFAVFEDGSRRELRDALFAHRVTVADLDRFGVPYEAVEQQFKAPAPYAKLRRISPYTWYSSFVKREDFYMGGGMVYYFMDFPADAVLVYYSDDARETVKKALEAGRITIEQLDAYHIPYYKEPLPSEVADIRFTKGMIYAPIEETFWSDGGYDYIFPNLMSHDCTVYYENGGSENLIDALDAGRVTVEDMRHFGISFSTRPVDNTVADIRYEGDPAADITAEIICVADLSGIGFYMDARCYDYVVEYRTGGVKPLLDALREGRVTRADLDRFEVPYWTEPK